MTTINTVSSNPNRQSSKDTLTDHIDLDLLHLGILQLGLPNNPLLPKFLEQSCLQCPQSFSSLTKSPSPATEVKDLLEKTKHIFDEMFLEGADIQALLALKAWLMDQILDALWKRYSFDKNLSLIAVGGYGRGELQPHSDIDLLILIKDTLTDQLGEDISSFITLLWDIGLEVGQSVRTIKETISLALFSCFV